MCWENSKCEMISRAQVYSCKISLTPLPGNSLSCYQCVWWYSTGMCSDAVLLHAVTSCESLTLYTAMMKRQLNRTVSCIYFRFVSVTTVQQKLHCTNCLNSMFSSDRQGVEEQLAAAAWLPYCTVAAAAVDDLLQPSTSGADTNTLE